MTARCAQYVSALKIVGLCKRKISRRLRKNLHITILSLFGGAGQSAALFPVVYIAHRRVRRKAGGQAGGPAVKPPLMYPHNSTLILGVFPLLQIADVGRQGAHGA